LISELFAVLKSSTRLEERQRGQGFRNNIVVTQFYSLVYNADAEDKFKVSFTFFTFGDNIDWEIIVIYLEEKRDMDIIKQYRQCRKMGMQLNSRIIESADKELFGKAAALLNMLEDNTIVLEEDYERDVLMDFIINERINGDKSVAETFLQSQSLENDVERDILNALISSYTSLFKIESILRDEKVIILNDILNERNEIKLTDIGFSETASPEMLLFTRIVPFDNFNMTSGLSFLFPAGREEYLLRRYRRIRRKYKAQDEATARFAAFFELNRTEGLLVKYQRVR